MKTVIITLTFLLGASLFRQSSHPEVNEDSYRAYLSNDLEEMKERWKRIVAITKEKSKASKNKDLLYQLAIAQYGLLAATMRNQDEALFDTYAEETKNNLESLISENKTWGEPNALLAAVLGLKMGYSPIKGILLGSKSQGLMAQAMKDAPSAPIVWKLYGNSKFFTPETFGGDVKEAIIAYEKVIKLYETIPEKIKHNWFYLDTMAFLGQAYLKDGQASKAIAIYEKALTVETGFHMG